jgi:AcrR family transcriptional regulator
MYHIKNDQRAIRSSEMLYKGLAALLRENDLSAITVTDLVEAAKVGRTTFYRNFDEIEDILLMRNDQMFEGLVSYLKEYRKMKLKEPRFAFLKPILRYFYLDSEIIELLIISKRINFFEKSFSGLLAQFKPMLKATYDLEEGYVDYLIAVNTGALTNILTHWIITGKKQAPDELADKLNMIYGSEKSPWDSFLR